MKYATYPIGITIHSFRLFIGQELAMFQEKYLNHAPDGLESTTDSCSFQSLYNSPNEYKIHYLVDCLIFLKQYFALKDEMNLRN